jgi:hypothetical protein
LKEGFWNKTEQIDRMFPYSWLTMSINVKSVQEQRLKSSCWRFEKRTSSSLWIWTLSISSDSWFAQTVISNQLSLDTTNSNEFLAIRSNKTNFFVSVRNLMNLLRRLNYGYRSQNARSRS